MSTDKALRTLRYIHYFLGTALVILTIAILASNLVLTVFRVDGRSMDPTLHDKQPLVVCLACLRVGDPQLNDIVIVQYAGEGSVTFVKRILGVPGDTVPYRGDYLKLADDEYFVVGDNRDHSTDSREYGPIKLTQIRGKVLGSFAPGPGGIE